MPETKRLPYRQPRLQKLGTVRDLTAADPSFPGGGDGISAGWGTSPGGS